MSGVNRVRRAVGAPDWPRPVRLALLLGLGAAAAVSGLLARQPVADAELFARAGSALLHGRPGEVYADPAVQAGPLQLLWWTAVVHGIGTSALSVVGEPAVVLAAAPSARWLRSAVGSPRRAWAEALAPLLVLGWGVSDALLRSGHPAQVVVPVAWVVAALTAARGRTVPAAALLALAAGWETWAVLGLPLLLLAPRPHRVRRVVAGAAVLAAGVAATYAPFALTGRFAMFDFRWPVVAGSLPAALAPHLPGVGVGVGVGFGWSLRTAQAGLAALACAGVVLALRDRRPDGVRTALWLAPLAAVAVRLLLDPVGYPYYWAAAVLLGLCGLLTVDGTDGCAGRRPAAAAACTAVLAWCQAVPALHAWAWTAALTLPLTGLRVVLAGPRALRRPDGGPPHPGTRAPGMALSAGASRTPSRGGPGCPNG